MKSLKPICAWAVLASNNCMAGMPGKLWPFGNGGNQFQYPIFHSRSEAKKWQKEDTFARGKIVKIEISLKDWK